MREAPQHLDIIGVVSATVAALCCIGVPALVSVFVAVGLGFLMTDAVLIPVLLVSLALIAWGLVAGWRRHRNISILIVAAGSAAVLVFAALISLSAGLAYAAIAGLLAASVWNTVLLRRRPARL